MKIDSPIDMKDSKGNDFLMGRNWKHDIVKENVVGLDGNVLRGPFFRHPWWQST